MSKKLEHEVEHTRTEAPTMDYYNIARMTQEFRKWDKDMLAGATKEAQAPIWALRAQMAIAQQLAVIAGHLAKIINVPEKP